MRPSSGPSIHEEAWLAVQDIEDVDDSRTVISDLRLVGIVEDELSNVKPHRPCTSPRLTNVLQFVLRCQ